MKSTKGNKLEVIYPRDKTQPQKDTMNIKWDVAFTDSMILKRALPYVSSILEEAQNEQVRNFRAIEKDGKLQKVAQLSSCDSDACSVGSCSVDYRRPFVQPPCQDWESCSSDAESCYGSERKSNSFNSQQDVEISIHMIELQAYRSTLEALYASGPLSWEKEAMLTNLRIKLHISNDEQLIELKSLISAKAPVNGNTWMHVYCFQRLRGDDMVSRVRCLFVGMNFG